MTNSPRSAPPSPFAGAAAYYDRYRVRYSDDAITHVVRSLGVDETARVLDLGCGPGALAIRLSPHVAEVVAVDPDPDMLAEGRRLAALAGALNIRWIEGRAEDLSPTLGRFRAATFGQSFHWMDRDRVLALLEHLIEDGGGIAHVAPGGRRPQESWHPAAEAVIARYLGPRTRHPGANPQEPEHQPALSRSRRFRDFAHTTFKHEIERDLNAALGFVYSLSYAARPLFGDRAEAFEADLRAALLALAPSGRFSETVETEVMIALKSEA